jgi:hypothetical protein
LKLFAFIIKLGTQNPNPLNPKTHDPLPISDRQDTNTT